jgi:hypothetical protein
MSAVWEATERVALSAIVKGPGIRDHDAIISSAGAIGYTPVIQWLDDS